MKRKLFAYGLSVALILVQNSFIFAQTAAPPRSTDELIALLNDPELVAVVNVKKMLTETAPTLLNRDAAMVGKLTAAMNDIENQTGINPYSLDKIALGLKFSQKTDDFMLIIQSDSAAKIAESVYQNQMNSARLANETNPLRERIFQVQNRLNNEGIDGSAETGNGQINRSLDNLTTAALELENAVGTLTRTKMSQPLIDQTQTAAGRINKTIAKIRLDFNDRIKSPDFKNRLDALEKQAKEISINDNQRAAKITDIGKELAKIDIEAADYTASNDGLRLSVGLGLVEIVNADALAKSLNRIQNLPTSEVARAPIYKAVLKELTDTQKRLDLIVAEFDSSSAVPPPMPPDKNAAPVAEVYPFSTVVTRKDEIYEGRKMTVMTTVEKFGGDREDKVKTSAMFAADERILMLGDRQTIIAALANKNADRNRATRDLIAKSGDALVAVGMDLKSVNLKDFGEIFGEQKNAWQIFGALSSQGNDLTLEATVEKTDRPLVITAKPADDKPKIADIPAVADKSFVTEIIDLLVKSVVGIEGKFTLRFDKKKAAAMIEESPNLLRKLTAGNQNNNQLKKQ